MTEIFKIYLNKLNIFHAENKSLRLNTLSANALKFFNVENKYYGMNLLNRLRTEEYP